MLGFLTGCWNCSNGLEILAYCCVAERVFTIALLKVSSAPYWLGWYNYWVDNQFYVPERSFMHLTVSS